jgi:predicted RNA-binding Zn ribbon-like protein
MDAEQLPILGEPLPVELANSLYLADGEATDFLATPASAQLWLEHALGPAGVDFPRAISASEAAALRELRDAAVEILSALCQHRTPKPTRVQALNRHAAAACAHVELVWSSSDQPSARVRLRGDRFSRMCAQLATACIELCTSEAAGEIRRCEGPGCSLMFVQHHRRRRFCHESCSHRARQRRYVQGMAREP